MKKFETNLSHLSNTEILTRSQLKKIVGGLLDEESLDCTTKCNVYKDGIVTRPNCLYIAGQSNLPGFCECPEGQGACS